MTHPLRNNLMMSHNFSLKNGTTHSQSMALTVSFVPNSLDRVCVSVCERERERERERAACVRGDNSISGVEGKLVIGRIDSSMPNVPSTPTTNPHSSSK